MFLFLWWFCCLNAPNSLVVSTMTVTMNVFVKMVSSKLKHSAACRDYDDVISKTSVVMDTFNTDSMVGAYYIIRRIIATEVCVRNIHSGNNFGSVTTFVAIKTVPLIHSVVSRTPAIQSSISVQLKLLSDMVHKNVTMTWPTEATIPSVSTHVRNILHSNVSQSKTAATVRLVRVSYRLYFYISRWLISKQSWLRYIT